jgi:pseudouridine-5'-phosphate glycosidase
MRRAGGGDAVTGVRVSAEVRDALAAGRGVVALETTLVAHGFPHPDGAAVGAASEEAVRLAGAVPATIGVLDGEIRVGLTAEETTRFGEQGAAARKLGPRDLAACAVQGAMGATTVGGTLAVCRSVGIRVMATGGLGGVHRGFPDPPDVSADLGELARVPVVVVSSGIKSLLDVPATCELLETLGVPVLGWRTDELPRFYSARGGPAVSARVGDEDEVARIAATHWSLGGGGVLVARPPETSLDDVDELIEATLAEARRRGVRGPAVTPYVLSRLHESSGGRTLRANRDLVVGNAALAGAIAVRLGAPAPRRA